MSIPVVPLGPASAYALYDLVEAHMLTYPDVTIRKRRLPLPARCNSPGSRSRCTRRTWAGFSSICRSLLCWIRYA